MEATPWSFKSFTMVFTAKFSLFMVGLQAISLSTRGMINEMLIMTSGRMDQICSTASRIRLQQRWFERSDPSCNMLVPSARFTYRNCPNTAGEICRFTDVHVAPPSTLTYTCLWTFLVWRPRESVIERMSSHFPRLGNLSGAERSYTLREFTFWPIVMATFTRSWSAQSIYCLQASDFQSPMDWTISPGI